MFGGLGNLGALIKQAQQIGGRLEGIGDELRSRRATGSAGGGLVEIEVNGLEEVLRCRIDASLFEDGDRELTEDLVRAAVNEAIGKAKQLHAEAMKNLAGGFQVPGLEEALARLSGRAGAEAAGGRTATEAVDDDSDDEDEEDEDDEDLPGKRS